MYIGVHMSEGDPTDEIVKTVKKRNIDLLTVLTHKEGSGNTSCSISNNELVRRMPCSILVVKKEPQAAAF
jgi:nucleotide-binding universal stress UspA family protein